jgi:hypothetical protein
MNFSYSAVWNDTVALLKSHGSLLLAVAGVFILLPLLMTAYFLPTPTSSTDPIGVLGRYYRENWHWLALASLINSIGSIAIYKLIFSGRGLSVGQAIGGALALLPFFFIATMIVSVAIGVGFAFLVIPGLYLLGRLAITAPTMVAENLRNPFSAMGESWRLTKGRGWAIAGLIANHCCCRHHPGLCDHRDLRFCLRACAGARGDWRPACADPQRCSQCRFLHRADRAACRNLPGTSRFRRKGRANTLTCPRP